MNTNVGCSIHNGTCHGYAICGYCYDFTVDLLDHQPLSAINNPYEWYNLFLIGFLLPTIGIFGLFGNSISAFIYSRRNMRSSMNMYLCALAASDITIIVTAFFLFFMESMRKRSALAFRSFAFFAPVTFPLGLSGQTLSIFLTIAAAFDCFVLVNAPQDFRERFCSTNTAKWVIATVVCLAVAFNIPHLFEISVIRCWSMPYAEVTYDVCPTPLRRNELYIRVYYAYMYTIVMAVGPVIVLICLNTCIILRLRKMARMSPTESVDSDTFTLVLVVCLFIACNVLPLTVNVLELLGEYVNPYIFDLSNLMVVLNSSCNFLIYYAFGSQFRRTLQQYLARVCGGSNSPIVKLAPPGAAEHADLVSAPKPLPLLAELQSGSSNNSSNILSSL